MSDTWSSLLSGVVGALVGGAASLAGTMVVNRRQMATNARMRLYDELLPKLARAIDDLKGPSDPVAVEQAPELFAAVRRASAIAGPFERKAAHKLMVLWAEHPNAPRHEIPTHVPVAVEPDPPDPPGYKRPPSPPSPEERRLERMQEDVRTLSDYLGAKLG
jgi:hypothetical protein